MVVSHKNLTVPNKGAWTQEKSVSHGLSIAMKQKLSDVPKLHHNRKTLYIHKLRQDKYKTQFSSRNKIFPMYSFLIPSNVDFN